jgi:hypothetical protein
MFSANLWFGAVLTARRPPHLHFSVFKRRPAERRKRLFLKARRNRFSPEFSQFRVLRLKRDRPAGVKRERARIKPEPSLTPRIRRQRAVNTPSAIFLRRKTLRKLMMIFSFKTKTAAQ